MDGEMLRKAPRDRGAFFVFQPPEKYILIAFQALEKLEQRFGDEKFGFANAAGV